MAAAALYAVPQVRKLIAPVAEKGLGLFKTPNPPEAPPAPATDTLGVQQKAGQTARRRSRSSGYRSTILSQQFMKPDAPALKDTIGS